MRRNWRQVAGLRPSVHQVGRKPYEQQYSLLLVQGVFKKNSIRFCDIHSLRHLHASMLINAGVDVVAVSADLGTRRLQRQRTSTVICSKKHRQGRAGQSPTHLSLTKKKSRAAKKPNFLLKNHKFKIRTSAVTEIKDFEQQREPCCFAIKTK